MRVLFAGRRKAGRLDLEAVQMLVRSAVHHAGATLLTELLQLPVPGADQRLRPCACGHAAHYQGLRSKPLLTALGPTEVSRPYYLCRHCHTGQFPADAELDIEDTEFSPGVRRMQAAVGQEIPFDHRRQQMKLPASLEVTTKGVERTAEAVGEEIAAREKEEIRRAMPLDLPVVVGEPVPVLYVEMDGAEWIWNLASQHFPGAIQIVDLFHARQHLWDLVRKLYPNDESTQKRWIRVQRHRLDKGKIEKLVLALGSIPTPNPELADKLRTETEYFQTNTERMRYPQFRGQHLFVGSGVIEAGCKTVVGSRLKRSGMFWTVRGANAILALRCCHLNGRFEDYWEARRAA